jgi:hypothetical protein
VTDLAADDLRRQEDRAWLVAALLLSALLSTDWRAVQLT